jgi:hypothetical protein
LEILIEDDDKIPFVSEQDKEMVKDRYKDEPTKEGWINIWVNNNSYLCSNYPYSSYEKAEKGRSDIFEYVCEPVKVKI